MYEDKLTSSQPRLNLGRVLGLCVNRCRYEGLLFGGSVRGEMRRAGGDNDSQGAIRSHAYRTLCSHGLRLRRLLRRCHRHRRDALFRQTSVQDTSTRPAFREDDGLQRRV